MFVDGNLPVRLHSCDEVLYSTIPCGLGFVDPTVVTTEAGSMLEESVFGSQLIYAMSSEVTLFSFEGPTCLRFPVNVFAYQHRMSAICMPHSQMGVRTATEAAVPPKPTSAVNGAILKTLCVSRGPPPPSRVNCVKMLSEAGSVALDGLTL
jgi:hypothetical protein